MGKYKNLEFNLSGLKNTTSYIMYYDRLFEICASMFKYINFPDTIDTRFLEKTLLERGAALFFEDEVLGFLGLPCAIGGRLNVYQIPTQRRAYAMNGYNAMRDETDSVIIYNNYKRKPSTGIIELFALRLAALDRVIDINVNAQKTPLFIQCDENQRLTFKNLYMQYEGNQPVIFGDKNLNPNAIKVLRTDSPYIADDIQKLKQEIWNDALSFFGVPVTENKKERMITSEAMLSGSEAFANRNTRLKMRQMACEKINEMFGLDTWIEMDTETMFIDPEDKPEDGEEEDLKIDIGGKENG